MRSTRWNLRHTAATKVLVRAAVEYCCVFPLRAQTRQLSETASVLLSSEYRGLRQVPHTNTYKLFLANWAKRLSWKETAEIFSTSWSSVYRAVKWCVCWGLFIERSPISKSIGVDEIQYRRGHTYMTLVYQLDAGCKRLLHVAKDRWEKSLDSFFDILPKETTKGIKFCLY